MILIKNQKGQMAIFIALFFQVIFVFFAMAINVGLVIHDKINLQNAVDIAAYYGAAKQGEVLNQMAHINYQMRQNYKLFVWRYRVLGTIGNVNHPLMYENTNSNLSPEASTVVAGDPARIEPAICVSHPFFQESKDLDQSGASLCRDNGQSVNVDLTPKPVGGLVLGSRNLGTTLDLLKEEIVAFCREAGFYNWTFAARILAHLRIDGLMRKEMIYKLARNLSRPDPLDLRGEPIEEGVRKTFELNLTDTNRNGIENFQYFNSMGADGQCSDPRFWIVDIKINPIIKYSDWNADTSDPLLCQQSKSVANVQGQGNPPVGSWDNMPYGFGFTEFADQKNSTQDLQNIWAGEPNDDSQSSVGFEKNPWCMVYSGVQASTRVRKPFDPTGAGIRLVARGFAKPFGGRFGPWYGKTWPQGSPNSQSGDTNQMVDPLLPLRSAPNGEITGAPLNGGIANYSRFPGDTLGLASRRAMSAMIQQFRNRMQFTSKDSTSPIAVANYDHLGGRPNLSQLGDSLARTGITKGSVQKVPNQRIFEVAAIAPDIFDALYYSIEPKYHQNYFSERTTNDGAQFEDAEELYDFGSSKDGVSAPPDFDVTSKSFNVLQQVEKAKEVYMADYPYIIKDWQHLLTSWHQKGVIDFTMDSDRFGRCNAPVENSEFPTTGNCLQGGRTGYSVKNISRDYLESGEHALGGGASGSTGKILNPPTF